MRGAGIAVVMGVSGVGKTAVGSAVAERLERAFFDGDDFHPDTNVARMRRGVPLEEHHREPWLAALRELFARLDARREEAVVACSALSSDFRRRLLDGFPGIALVHLRAPREVVLDRLTGRTGHFAGPELLASQLATLEQPADAIVVDAGAPLDEVVEAVVHRLGGSGRDAG